MQQSGTSKKAFILGSLLLMMPLIILLFGNMNHTFGTLPYYYPDENRDTLANGPAINDTVWQKIPDFTLINQDNQTITRADFEGHVFVVDFFFTTCTTICPIMNQNMAQLAFLLDEKYFEELKFLSISVDPEYDRPPILTKYAEKMGGDPRWTFATGEKDPIYSLGVNGFKLSTREDLEAAGGFLHSEKMVLVDRNLHIRGYYDGTDPIERTRLQEDLELLVGEYRLKNKD